MQTAQILHMPHEFLYPKIELYLKRMGKNSKNTAINYEHAFKLFFEKVCDKEIQHVTLQDILDVTRDKMYEYQHWLQEKAPNRNNKGYSNTTTNQRIAAIRGFIVDLKKDFRNIDLINFEVDLLPEDTVSYGVLSFEECMEMLERVEKQKNTDEKALMITLALLTSFRLDSLLKLKWSDIKRINGYRVVTTPIVKGKGIESKGNKYDEKPIAEEFYQELLKLKKDNSEYIFTLSGKTFERTIDGLAKEMGISDRYITFHSLKKAGVYWTARTTGDIRLTQLQGSHANPVTTLKHYLNAIKDYSQMPSYNMMNKLDFTELEEMSKDELLNLIKNSSYMVKNELIKNAKKN